MFSLSLLLTTTTFVPPLTQAILGIGDTYCNDANECNGNSVNSANAYCYGYDGCYSSKLDLNEAAYCYGYQGCYYSEIVTDEDAFCYGADGCSYSMIESHEGDVYCLGRQGCYGADITKSDTVYVFGDTGAAYADIANPTTVQGYGYYSLRYADIIVSNAEETNVEIYGYYATLSTAVWCLNGSSCTVDCKGYGCYDVNVYCFNGANCDTTCFELGDCVSRPNVIHIGARNTLSYVTYNEYKDQRAQIKSEMKENLKNEFELFVESNGISDDSGSMGGVLGSDAADLEGWEEIQMRYESETNEKLRKLAEKYALPTIDSNVNSGNGRNNKGAHLQKGGASFGVFGKSGNNQLVWYLVVAIVSMTLGAVLGIVGYTKCYLNNNGSEYKLIA